MGEIGVYLYCSKGRGKKRTEGKAMKLRIKKIPGVRGFVGTTYAVYQGQAILKIFESKKEAEKYVSNFKG